MSHYYNFSFVTMYFISVSSTDIIFEHDPIMEAFRYFMEKCRVADILYPHLKEEEENALAGARRRMETLKHLMPNREVRNCMFILFNVSFGLLSIDMEWCPGILHEHFDLTDI